MQEFLKSEVDSVQRQIDSALAGINIVVEETISSGKALQAHTHIHPALVMAAWGGRRPILSNAFARSNGRAARYDAARCYA